MGVSQAVRNPRSFVVRTGRLYRTLLFDPRTFYDDYVGSAGLTRELLLLAVIGAVGLLGNYYAIGELTTAFTEAGVVISQDANYLLWQTMLAPLVGAFLLWIGLAVTLYAVSWLYSEVGKIYLVLKWSAWALLPMLFANLIHTIAVVVTVMGVDIQDALPVQTTIPEEKVALIWSQVGGEPLVIGATLVAIPFFLWSAYIVTYAIADVRDLELSEAYRVAAVPAIGYSLYVVRQLIGSI